MVLQYRLIRVVGNENFAERNGLTHRHDRQRIGVFLRKRRGLFADRELVTIDGHEFEQFSRRLREAHHQRRLREAVYRIHRGASKFRGREARHELVGELH